MLALLGEDDAGGEKRSAVYARVSTAKQAEAGSLERQRLRLLEYAAVNGYRVVLQASDVASGRNARRRGLRRVVQAARRHEVALGVTQCRGMSRVPYISGPIQSGAHI